VVEESFQKDWVIISSHMFFPTGKKKEVRAMKISATFYNDAGELMAPRPLDMTLASVTPGGIPSIEAGFYHRFKFEGRTQKELDAKSRRFFENMRAVPGYSTLVLRPYTVEMGSYVRHGLDVVYAVELTHRPAHTQSVQTSTDVAITR
jgi:hypothetical protein